MAKLIERLTSVGGCLAAISLRSSISARPVSCTASAHATKARESPLPGSVCATIWLKRSSDKQRGPATESVSAGAEHERPDQAAEQSRAEHHAETGWLYVPGRGNGGGHQPD